VPFDVEALGVDLASISAHKMYGPKGVGGLYVRRSPRVTLEPQTVGGSQEQGLRAGTLNVPGIVGFGAAAAIARDGITAEQPRVAALRDRLLAGLRRGLDGVAVSGSLEARLPHNLHVRFDGVDGEALMTSLADDLAVSSGSACASGSREPSHVMLALGLDVVDRWGAVRFGLGRGTTADEIDRAIDCVVERVARLRAMSPVGVGGRS
jgi:cysteine desulfurase